MSDDTVPLARLGRIGPSIGAGAQGTIHPLADHPGWLYKRYHDEVKVDVDGLRALVAWRAGLDERERQLVDVRTSWPVRVVTGAAEVGVVIRRAPGHFTRIVEGARVPLDLQFAYFATAARWAGVEPVPPRGAVTIVFRVAQVLDVLHRRGVVYGDLSHTNVLWSGASDRPTVFIIDCDAAWVTSAARPVAAGQTPMWADPWPSDGSPDGEMCRDLYKLALLFLRVYNRSTVELGPGSTSVAFPSGASLPLILPAVRDLLLAGLSSDPHRRPAARRWLGPLRRLDHHLAARPLTDPRSAGRVR